jgi:hypothetical protein
VFCAGLGGVKPVTADWWGGQQRLFLIVGSAGCLRSRSLDDEADHGFVFLTADPSFRQLEIGDRLLGLEPESHGLCTGFGPVCRVGLVLGRMSFND